MIATRSRMCCRATSHRPSPPTYAMPSSSTRGVRLNTLPSARTYPSSVSVSRIRRAVGRARSLAVATSARVSRGRSAPKARITSSPRASASMNSGPSPRPAIRVPPRPRAAGTRPVRCTNSRPRKWRRVSAVSLDSHTARLHCDDTQCPYAGPLSADEDPMSSGTSGPIHRAPTARHGWAHGRGVPHPGGGRRAPAGISPGLAGARPARPDGGNAHHTAGPLWTDTEPDRLRRRCAGVDAGPVEDRAAG